MAKKTLKDYVKIKEKINQLKKEAQEDCKEIFQNALKDIFKKFPKLESVSWTQYTPYFNDGEECTFSRHDPEITYNEKEYDNIGEWSFNPENRYSEEYLKVEGLQESWKEINELMLTFEDEDFEFMFGDHVKVVSTKDSIDVEDYNHD